jgi:DNA-binding response OmpR family regulator
MSPAAKADSQTSQRRPLTIFIADDNVKTVSTLSTILRDEGHVVHTCANGALARDAIRRYKPDVCILDIVMPGKNGFSIAREVKTMNLPQVPVLIAISAVFIVKDKLLAEWAGFDHFLVKPADPRELLDLLYRISGRDAPPEA